MAINFKPGDLIFYFDKSGGTIPTTVWSFTRKMLIVQNWEDKTDAYGQKILTRTVSPKNCQLQSEWKKEHAQE